MICVTFEHGETCCWVHCKGCPNQAGPLNMVHDLHCMGSSNTSGCFFVICTFEPYAQQTA